MREGVSSAFQVSALGRHCWLTCGQALAEEVCGVCQLFALCRAEAAIILARDMPTGLPEMRGIMR